MNREPTLRKSFTLQKNEIFCTCPYGNNEYIAAGLSNGIINLLPVSSNCSLKKLIGHKGSVNCLETCSLSHYIASGGSDGTVRLWIGNEEGDSTSLNIGKGSINSIDLSSQFDKIIILSEDNSSEIWDPRHCSKLIEFDNFESNISSNSISSDGLVALTGSLDGIIRLFDIRSGQCTKSINIKHPIISSSIRQTGSTVAVGCSNGIVISWDTRTQSIINYSQIHNDSITSIEFHPKKPLLLTSSNDNNLSLCDSDNLSLLFTLQCHNQKVYSTKWSFDGSTFSSCGEDKRIVLWDEPILSDQFIQQLNQNDKQFDNINKKKKKTEKLGKFNEKIIEINIENNNNNIPLKPQNIVKIEDNHNMKNYIGMLHQVTNQIKYLSETVSKLENQMVKMDEQISILESIKRKQVKSVIKNYQ